MIQLTPEQFDRLVKTAKTFCTELKRFVVPRREPAVAFEPYDSRQRIHFGVDSVSFTLDAGPADSPISATVDCRQFSQLPQSGLPVGIDSSDSTLAVSDTQSNATIPTLPSWTPETRDVRTVISTDSRPFLDRLKDVSVSVSRDLTRPGLQTAHIAVDSAVRMFCTDSYQLSYTTLDGATVMSEGYVQAPATLLTKIAGLWPSDSLSVGVSEDGRHGRVWTENWQLRFDNDLCQRLDDMVEAALKPAAEPAVVRLVAHELAAAATECARNNREKLLLHVDKDRSVVEVQSTKTVDLTVTVPALAVDGTPADVALDPARLVKLLKPYRRRQVQLKICGTLKPVLLDDGEIQSAVMPLRVGF